MNLLIVLACAVALCFALRNPLKRFPVLFYALAVTLDVLYFASMRSIFLPPIWDIAFVIGIYKCELSFSLFAVVMYVGVFPNGSRVKNWLSPIRAQVSIIACILACGHIIPHLMSYAPLLVTFGLVQISMQLSIILAICLTALLLALGTTSFTIVRKRMKVGLWKRIQKLSYVFYGMVYLHLMLMLLPSALAGGICAMLNITVYTIIFGTYAIARVHRASK